MSSLKSELQESLNAGRAAPAALLVLPVKAMLSHHQSDATLGGQHLPRQQPAERHGHLAGLPTEVQNPGVPEHATQNFISCQVKLCQEMAKREVFCIFSPAEPLGAGGEQTHQQLSDPPQEPRRNRGEKLALPLKPIKAFNVEVPPVTLDASVSFACSERFVKNIQLIYSRSYPGLYLNNVCHLVKTNNLLIWETEAQLR